ncbi:uncharacterized protein NMK_3111 [Novimethylophilus kurashikiensis]|uniref:DUF1289 domain-containing protein n=1 Tax=Novimethylophilus kurashikiensis TaxID=1825523 RepID=A0A2R5FG34_9PROT|nr:DUF1289 domain-containing protein [Novimethylophilus kurashikiensis]GBG15503.1 uncharacterized protein NMK_3111 [Novimethylophilus kurashikiensis]
MSVPSPCNGLCRINMRSGLCEGCLRTREEIGSWRMLPDPERQQLLLVLEQRKVTKND